MLFACMILKRPPIGKGSESGPFKYVTLNVSYTIC